MVKVHISYDGQADSVQVAGSFGEAGGQDWIPENLHYSLETETWGLDLNLVAGCYAYKLIVNGEWILVPGAETDLDDDGNTNSLLIVEDDEDDLEDSDENTNNISSDLENLMVKKDLGHKKIVDIEDDIKVERAFLIKRLCSGVNSDQTEAGRRITRGLLSELK